MRALILPLAALLVLCAPWDVRGASKGSKSSHASPPKSQVPKPAKASQSSPRPQAKVNPAPTSTPAAVAVPGPTVQARRYGYGTGRGYRRYPVYRRGRGFVQRTNPVLARLNRLTADIASIGKGAVLTTTQRNQLQHDLTAVVDGPQKPVSGSVRQLAGDLATAVAKRRSQLQTPAQLAYHLKVVLNSPTVANSQVNTSLHRSESILKTAGVGLGSVQLVRSDLNALAQRGGLANAVR